MDDYGYRRIRKGKREDPAAVRERLRKGYGTEHPERISGSAGLFFGTGDVYVSEPVGEFMEEETFGRFVLDSLRRFEKEDYGDISAGDEAMNTENRWLGSGDEVMGRYGFFLNGRHPENSRYDEVIRIRTWEGDIWITYDAEPDLFLLLKENRAMPERTEG